MNLEPQLLGINETKNGADETALSFSYWIFVLILITKGKL
jgi:hypothetical protein